MMTQPQLTQLADDPELLTPLQQTAVNLMILFPDLPHDEALLQAKAWVGFFAIE
ncbi:hypothetical protein [Fibrisoma montanum]|uniref:hypothetical protein n=1 Tax=Fibrisoma montanum TaxID=2305895 RepID=UPI0018F477D9|nr:hypothetical protein [Fibrisoma montanum]